MGRDYKLDSTAEENLGLFQELKEHLGNTKGKIAFIPESSFRGVSDFLRNNMDLPADSFVDFPNEWVLEQYIGLSKYGLDDDHRAIAAALVDTNLYMDQEIPQVPVFQYAIRMNASETPDLKGYDAQSVPDTHLQPVDKMQVGYQPKEWNWYYKKGFFLLQSLTDLFILNRTGAVQLSPAPTITEIENLMKIRVQPYPTYGYRKDAFSTAMGDYIGLFFTLVFVWPVTRIVASIVEEKELKIKEGMKIMGLSSTALSLSWLITYGIMFAISCFLIVLGTFSSLYSNSNLVIVYVYFLTFCAAVYSFSFMMSTLFDKASMGSTISAIVFIGSFFIYNPVKAEGVSRQTKLFASIFPSVALALSSTTGAKLESAQLGITQSTISNVYDNFAFSDGLTMLAFDAVIYYIIGLYLEQIVKSEYGVEKPWYFPFTYFCKSRKQKPHTQAPLESLLADPFSTQDDLMSLNEPYTKMEPPSSHERGQEMISIRNLRKVFNVKGDDGEDKEFVAVRNLSLDMYRGQIFALLGHNGAGKSTTISMITALTSITSGSIKILGRDAETEIEQLRKNFGYCPQHDLLYPYLSVEEHLRLYCAIKGVPKENQEREINEIIDEVGLGQYGDNKRTALAGTLSGGQMRKLSVGIALIGGSPIVFLDEPSSGMDVASQRFIWELLLKCKKDRMILLTTHSMEEAEIGDRIAILAHSVLQCCGSSLYLKNNYGCGYTLSISKSQTANTDPVAAAAATAASKKLVSLYPGCTTQSGSEIAKYIIGKYPYAELSTDAGGEISFRLPFSSVDKFPELFEDLDANMKTIGISTYGISVTTLTEVFLRVGQGQEVPEDVVDPLLSPPTSPTVGDSSANSQYTFGNVDLINSPSSTLITNSGTLNNSNTDSEHISLNDLPDSSEPEKLSIDEVYSGEQFQQTGFELFKTHTKALLYKRYNVAKRDRKQWMWQILYPAIILILSLQLQQSSNENTFPERLMMGNLYGDTTYMAGSNTKDSNAVSNLYINMPRYMSTTVVPKHVLNITNNEGVTPNAFTQYLFDSGMKTDPRYISIPINDYKPTEIDAMLYFNTSAKDALPVAWNTLSNSMLRARYPTPHKSEDEQTESTSFLGRMYNSVKETIFGKTVKIHGAGIVTLSRPFPRTANEMLWLTASVAFSLAMAFSFVPATFASFIVKERADQGKHLQIISGVSPYAYWFSTLLWDLINFTLPYLMGMFLLFSFNVNALLGDAIPATTIVFWLFCLSVAPFVYCLSFAFDNHSTAQNMILLANFLVSVILLIVMIVMDSMDSTHDINAILRFFYRLLPPFCFGEALAGLIMRQSPSYFAVPPSPFALNVSGWPILFMILDFFIYGGILLYLEYVTTHESSIFRNVPDDGKNTLDKEDDDVKEERLKIENGQCDDYNKFSIVLKGLRKIYPARMGSKPHIAVNNLSFSVKKGECFGFLGANGAGKSTTMKMLSGSCEYPTKGTALLGGYDIVKETDNVRQLIGYCPQFDAIHPLLTAREHLYLYARIKCVPEKKIPGFATYLLEKLGLMHLADRPAGTYSGGNKRKLSVGISIVGNPQIVFLDEPSTGVDAASRRGMWKLISSTMKHRSVILTTHSMEEAEALCDRISIITSGNLRALGTAQHLKSKFGEGWQLIIRAQDGKETKVQRELAKLFPGIVLLEAHGLNLKFRVPKHSHGIASVFRILNQHATSAGIETYSVSETTLEQIFVQMVQNDLERLSKQRKEEALLANNNQ